MTRLTVALSDLKRLCAIDPADTTQDAGLAALLLAEQPPCEYALDPGILLASASDPGLLATLTLGAAECLAGSYLRQQARAPGVSDDFHVGPLSVSASRTDGPAQAGERLAVLGERRLGPFARATKRVAYDASLGLPDGSSKAALLALTSSAPSVFDGCSFDTGSFDDMAGDVARELAREGLRP